MNLHDYDYDDLAFDDIDPDDKDVQDDLLLIANSLASESIGEIPLSTAEYARITSMSSAEIDVTVREYIAVYKEAGDDSEIKNAAFCEIQKYMQGLIKSEITKILKKINKTQDEHLYKRMFNFGLLGLMRAISRFDLSFSDENAQKKAKFSSYAYSEIIKMLRKASNEELELPSTGVADTNKEKVKKALYNFINTVGREPDIVDLYYELKCELEMEKIKDCLNVINAGKAAEIDPDKEYEGLYGFKESVEDEVEKNEQREYVDKLLQSLSKADPNGDLMADVIRMSFGLEGADDNYDDNFAGIGKALGISTDTAKKYHSRGMMLLQELAGVKDRSRTVSVTDLDGVRKMAEQMDGAGAVSMTPEEYLRSKNKNPSDDSEN